MRNKNKNININIVETIYKKLIGNKLLVGLMLAIFIFSRLINWGSNPISLNRDELALGYNAFSLVHEGQDEWGKSWPLVFRSFGDYKLPGYIYILTPLVWIFGISDWLVRLPSLMAGLANVILIFFILKEVFPKEKWLWWFSSFILLISPWAVHYSRVAFEAHVGLAFTLLTIYWLICGLKKSKYLILALFSLLVAMFTYNSPLILAPFIIGSYVFTFRKILLSKNRRLLMSIFLITSVVAIAIAGAVLFSVSKAKSGIVIFSDPTLNDMYRKQKIVLMKKSPILGKLIGNKYVFFGKVIIKNYTESFLPKFLVFQGGEHPWHSIPGWAHLTRVEYLLFIGGLIFYIFVVKKTKKQKWLLFLLLVSILPAAITTDAPHTTRSLLFLSLLVVPIGLAFGVIGSLTDASRKTLNKNIVRKIFMVVVAIGLVGEFSIFMFDYYYKFPKNLDSSWKPGLKQAILKIGNSDGLTQKKKVVITDYQSSPYIYVLFYNRVISSKYLSGVKYYPLDNAGLEHVKSFGNYWFVDDRDSNNYANSIIIKKDKFGWMRISGEENK